MISGIAALLLPVAKCEDIVRVYLRSVFVSVCRTVPGTPVRHRAIVGFRSFNSAAVPVEHLGIGNLAPEIIVLPLTLYRITIILRFCSLRHSTT